MKLEDQVTSLEISKKLKELGVRQKSAFYWTTWLNYLDKKVSSLSMIDHADIDPFVRAENIILNKGCSECNHITKVTKSYSAFTVAELGEMLPEEFLGYSLELSKRYDNYEVGYFDIQREEGIDLTIEKNEAHARAGAIIKLLGRWLNIDTAFNAWKEKWLEVKGE